MTTLRNSIKFRSLIDQLSKQEFLKFMTQIFDNKTNLVETALFRHFISSKNNNDNQLNNINSILSNIIQSRKTKSKPLPTNIKFDQLPLQLIGHTASFLDQSSYFRLQKVNRSTFIGCNRPNKLQILNLTDIKDYKSINLSEYRSLKQLKININKFNELILPNNGQFIMNELDEISLHAKEATDCDIEAFMNQNCINIENIKTFKLLDFGSIAQGQQFNVDKFERLLTKFPNVQYLKLRGCKINGIDTDKLKESYPNLTRLTVDGGSYRINNELVNIFGNNLHSLFHTNGHTDLSDVDFNKLEELVLASPDMDTINNILKTARNLRKVHFAPFEQNKDEIKSVIPQILKCESLEFLEIAANNDEHHGAILEGIEIGLYKTNKWKREKLKIEVWGIDMKTGIDTERAVFNIGRIILRLEASSNIKNFMFIWDMRSIDSKLDKEEILRNLADISSNVTVRANGLSFVITNTECKINGWSESWMISVYDD